MPVITFSRQEASAGDLVAKMVSDRLDYAFFDREAMVRAAQEQGVTIGKVPEIDEKSPSFWERLDEERRRYNLLLRYLVFDCAQRGRCVIVGHGAQAFLSGLNHVLKVKVIAPFEMRVRRLMAESGMAYEAAGHHLRHSDRNRAGYSRYLFQKDWLNPELYDLVLNTAQTKPETMADLVVRAASADDLIASATSLQILADRALASRVEIRLLLDPRIGSSGVRVLVNRGVVTLSGSLATEEEKEAAEEVAAETPGITRLASELVVMPITATIYP